MLGALGEGDLGCHFPDDDPAYHDISSQEILKRISSMVKDRGYRVVNVDSTIVAERPRMVPHTSKMREVLSTTLGIPSADISIKATTMEKLGSIGREEGIAAMAAVLLEED
jgi:2-C-methyl-D-erythritol 2,4-cyclodiphosphate synthase